MRLCLSFIFVTPADGRQQIMRLGFAVLAKLNVM